MEERFNMSSQIKKVVMALLGVGLLCMVISLVMMYAGATEGAGHGHGAHAEVAVHGDHGHGVEAAYTSHDVTN